MLKKETEALKNKAKREFIFLGAFLAFIVFAIIMFGFLNNKNGDNSSNEQKEIILLEDIKNNYDVYYTISLNKETFETDIRKHDNNRIIVLHEKKVMPYLCFETDCYLLDMEKGSAKKADVPLLFKGLDDTFLELENISNLLKRAEKKNDNIYVVKVSDVIKEYNFINFTEINTDFEDTMEMELKYGDKEAEINFDYSIVNKIITNKDDEIKIKIKIENIGNVDLSNYENYIENII